MAATAVLSAIIVDDEPLGRERVRSLCGQLENLTVLGEAGEGAGALEMIRRLQPDIVFLDIQMPEMDGIQVAEALQSSDMPVVVFVTAYDEYAIRAFELHAVDYLLKPFDLDRFSTAVDRARERRASGLEKEALAPLLEDLRDRPRYPVRLSVRNRDTIRLVRIEEIDWIGSAGNYVEIHVGKETHLLRQTMTAMENSLDPDRFIRIHRTTIVNIERIKQIRTLFKGEHQVQLLDGTRLTLSRGYRDRLDAFAV
jgi:two-component system LytT family response regulator